MKRSVGKKDGGAGARRVCRVASFSGTAPAARALRVRLDPVIDLRWSLGVRVPRAVRVRNPGASTAEASVRARGPPRDWGNRIAHA